MIYIDNLHRLLAGFWVGDPDFCQEANISLFLLQIGDKTDGTKNRSCYLVCQNSEGLLINEPTSVQFTYSIWKPENWIPSLSRPKYFEVKFKDINESTFPDRQQCRFYPVCNKLVMLSGNTITGVFYKNSANTEMVFINNEKTKNNNTGDNGDADEL